MSPPQPAQTNPKLRKRQRAEDELPLTPDIPKKRQKKRETKNQTEDWITQVHNYLLSAAHAEPLASDTPKRSKDKTQKTSEKDDSTIEESPPSMKPRDAPVPLPNIIKFNPMVGNRRAAGRSPETQEKTARIAAQNSANRWLKFAPSYRIPGVKLSELKRRKKNREEDIDAANDSIARMEDVEPDACSAKFVDDETGETLVCVFSHRAPGPSQIAPEEEKKGQEKEDAETSAKEKQAQLPAYPGSDKRTLKYVEGFKHRYWDGIPTEMLRRYHQCAQELHKFLPPHANKRDIRHPNETIMTYSHEPYAEGPEYVRDGVGDDDQIDDDQTGAERTGVTHLVHAWHRQGHPLDHMTHSRDMAGRGSCTAEISLDRYYVGSRPVALYLSACFQVAFPDYYVKYRAAFEAGVWTAEDPGPWIGRAIVWKLPVRTHVDGLDEGPTAIFNVGSYTGGKLYLPDLGVKLEYDPGTVVIFLSGQLYHSVSEWKPGKLAAGDDVTPGRVGNVFFFPKASFDKLHGKPAKWNKRTMTGTLPDVGESKR